MIGEKIGHGRKETKVLSWIIIKSPKGIGLELSTRTNISRSVGTRKRAGVRVREEEGHRLY